MGRPIHRATLRGGRGACRDVPFQPQGLSQGLSRGKREPLRRLLELKFGSISSEAVVRLEVADGAALERYAERVITATSVGEVLSD